MKRLKSALRREDEQPALVDPIALTLAIWLGLIVGVTGLVRLSENAADRQAAMAQTMAEQGKPRPLPADPILPFQAAGYAW